MEYAIMDTSCVVSVLESYRKLGRGPGWFESRLEGRVCIPRAVESEFKKIQKLNRRGKGRRPGLSWLARLPGSQKDWIYGLYRDPGTDAELLRRIESMHGGAAGSPESDGARAWMASKRARVSRMGAGARGGPRAVLRRLYIEAAQDRVIMAQSISIARASGGAVLVSRDGDFVSFAATLKEISGGSMRVLRPEAMP